MLLEWYGSGVVGHELLVESIFFVIGVRFHFFLCYEEAGG